ncbi:hypothetical protein [Streptomyces lavendulocolor]|uniref:hypothetical protein n=1 Tax=Streptomyces lavendulocolor TaxID=67316 RepID=UPI0033C84D7E
MGTRKIKTNGGAKRWMAITGLLAVSATSVILTAPQGAADDDDKSYRVMARFEKAMDSYFHRTPTGELVANDSPLDAAFQAAAEERLEELGSRVGLADRVVLAGFPAGVDSTHVETDGKPSLTKFYGQPSAGKTLRERYSPSDALKMVTKAAQDAVDGKREWSHIDAHAAKTFLPSKSNPTPHVRASSSDVTISDLKSTVDGELKAEGGVDIDVKRVCQYSPGSCMFTGVIDEKYPVKWNSADAEGPIELGRNISQSFSSTSGTVFGYSIGGKVSLKGFLPFASLESDKWNSDGESVGRTERFKNTEAELGPEVTVAYSYTKTHTETSGTKESLDTSAPVNEGNIGHWEARFRGAYYIGYIFVHYLDPSHREIYTALPARVLVRADEAEHNRGGGALDYSLVQVPRPFSKTIHLNAWHETQPGRAYTAEEKLQAHEYERINENMEAYAPLPNKVIDPGYPVGIDITHEGHVDVKSKKLPSGKTFEEFYPPAAALKDAKDTADAILKDPNSSNFRRGFAAQFNAPPADTKPDCAPPNQKCVKQETFLRTDSSQQRVDTHAAGSVPTVAEMCRSTGSVCFFTGHVDQKYPNMKIFNHETGPETVKLTWETSEVTTDTISHGFSVSGKLVGKGKTKGESPTGDADLGFTISNAWTKASSAGTSTSESRTLKIPAGKVGRIEARANGAYYVGYVVCRCVNYYNQPQSGFSGSGLPFTPGGTFPSLDAYIVVPAKALYASPHRNSSPLSTWSALYDNPRRHK